VSVVRKRNISTERPPLFGEVYYYYYLVCEAIGTAATPSLLCQPWVIVKMIVKKQMECRLAGETEVLGENLPQRPLLSITKSHMTRPGFEPGPPRWEAGDYHYFFIIISFVRLLALRPLLSYCASLG
jgi:hypothetical protein